MLEIFYTGLLVAVSALGGWFAIYVVYKLIKGKNELR